MHSAHDRYEAASCAFYEYLKLTMSISVKRQQIEDKSKVVKITMKSQQMAVQKFEKDMEILIKR